LVAERDEASLVRALTLALVALAVLILEQALLEPGRSQWVCLARAFGLGRGRAASCRRPG
jgi:hypothetical protein